METAGAYPRIREAPPTIFHVDARGSVEYLDMCRDVLAKYRNTLSEDRRVLLDRYHLVDVAIKVVSIGSVGTLCMVALMMSIADRPFFLQIKEANASVLRPTRARAPMPNTASLWFRVSG